MSDVKNFYTFMKGSQKVDHIESQVLNFNFAKTEEELVEKEPLSENDAVLLNELSPFFFGKREEAHSFLCKIKGAKPTQIVSTINALIKERKISAVSCGKPLWTLLHDCGLYLPELRNWNYYIETN